MSVLIGQRAAADQFEVFRRQNNTVDLPSTLKRDATAQGYAFVIRKVRVRVPHGLPSYAATYGDVSMGLKFRLTTFDTTAQYNSETPSIHGAFVGRAYTSHARTVLDLHNGFVESPGDIFYFITSLKDTAIHTVVEIILTIHDKRGLTIDEFAAGWTILSLFAPGRAHVDVGDAYSTRDAPLDAGLFSGSPRVLYVSPPGTTSFPHSSGSLLLYNIYAHRALTPMRHLVPDAVFFGAMEPIPGLKLQPVPAKAIHPKPWQLDKLDVHATHGEDSFLIDSPVADESGLVTWLPCMSNSIFSTVSPIAPKLERAAILHFTNVRVYFPEDFEKRLVATIAGSREIDLGLAPKTLTSTHVRVVQRQLVLTLHNGHSVVAKASQPLNTEDVRATSAVGLGKLADARGTVLSPEMDIAIRGWVCHGLMAVILSLEYVIAEPTAAAFGLTKFMPAPESTGLAAGPEPTAAAGKSALTPSAGTPGPGTPAKIQQIEQFRRILAAEQIFVPAIEQKAGSLSGPPKFILHQTNRSRASDPAFDNTFTRRPLEVPLSAPNPQLQLQKGIWIDGTSVISESVPFTNRNVVVGTELKVSLEPDKPLPPSANSTLAPLSVSTPARNPLPSKDVRPLVHEEDELEDSAGLDASDVDRSPLPPPPPPRPFVPLAPAAIPATAVIPRQPALKSAEDNDEDDDSEYYEDEDEDDEDADEDDEDDEDDDEVDEDDEDGDELSDKHEDERAVSAPNASAIQPTSMTGRNATRTDAPAPAPREPVSPPRPKRTSPVIQEISPASVASLDDASPREGPDFFVPPPNFSAPFLPVDRTAALMNSVFSLRLHSASEAAVEPDNTEAPQPAPHPTPTALHPSAVSIMSRGLSGSRFGTALSSTDIARLQRLGAFRDDPQALELAVSNSDSIHSWLRNSVELEISDSFSATSFSIRFAALKLEAVREHLPFHVFFRLSVHASPVLCTQQCTGAPDSECEGYQILSTSGESMDIPTVNVAVDPTAFSPMERVHFAEYMRNGSVQVDVMDATSQVPCGVFYLPMVMLMRQQRKKTCIARQFQVFAPKPMSSRAGTGQQEADLGNVRYVGSEGGTLFGQPAGLPVGCIRVVMTAECRLGHGRLDNPEATVRRAVGTTLEFAPMASSGMPQKKASRSTRVRTIAKPLTEATSAFNAGLLDSMGAGRVVPVDSIGPGGGESLCAATSLSAEEVRTIQKAFDASGFDSLVPVGVGINYGRFVDFVCGGAVDLPAKVQSMLYDEVSSENSEPASVRDKCVTAFRKEAQYASGAETSDSQALDAFARKTAFAFFEHAEAYVKRKGTQYQRRLASLGSNSHTSLCPLEDDPENDMENLAWTKGEASVAGSLQAGQMTAGRIRHTLRHYFQLHLSDQEFRTLLQGTGIETAAEDDPSFVIDYRRVVDFILPLASTSAYSGLTTRTLKASKKLRAEVTVLRGKIEQALTASSATGARAQQLLEVFSGADFLRKGHIPWKAFSQQLLDRLCIATPQADGGQDASAGSRQLLRASEMASSGTQIFQTSGAQDLELVRLYREGQKRDQMRAVLKESVTTLYHVYPTTGRVLYVQHTIRNPYPHEQKFIVDIAGTTRLRLCKDAREFEIIKSKAAPACPDAGSCHNMEAARLAEFTYFSQATAESSSSSVQLTVPAGSWVSVPFLYCDDDLITTAHTEPYGVALVNDTNNVDAELPLAFKRTAASITSGASALQRVTLSEATPMESEAFVTFTAVDFGHTVAQVRFQVHPRPAVIHRRFEFYCAENEYMRGVLPLPPVAWDHTSAMRPSPGAFVRVPSKNVVVAIMDTASSSDGLQDRELHFKCRVDACPRKLTFPVILCNDPAGAEVFEVWAVTISPMLRFDVRAMVGQSVNAEMLYTEGHTSFPRTVRLATSHPDEVRFLQRSPFALMPSSINRLQMTIAPSTAGERTFIVRLLQDVDSLIIASWLIRCASALPPISRAYPVTIPIGQRADKKIPYSNPWNDPRTINVSSSNPAVVAVKTPTIVVPAHGKEFIRLAIGPIMAFGNQDVHLIVADTLGNSDETLLLSVSIQ